MRCWWGRRVTNLLDGTRRWVETNAPLTAPRRENDQAQAREPTV